MIAKGLSKFALVSALLCYFAGLSFGFVPCDITVVVNGPSATPLPGVQVLVSYFDANGDPDPVRTKVGITDGSGIAQFPGLPPASVSYPYMVFVTKHGWSPTVKDQFMGMTDPTQFAPVTFSSTRTITMANDLVTGKGIVKSEVILPAGTAPAFVFGSVNLLAGEDIAYGVLKATADTGCYLEINNVPVTSLTDIYGAGCFCPALNLSYGTQVTATVTENNTTVTSAIDLTSPEAMAPEKTESQDAYQGNISFKGVCQDASSEPVSGVNINIEGWWGTPHQGPWIGNYCTQTDDNGYYKFYDDLPLGATYIFRIGRNGYKGSEYNGPGDQGICYDGSMKIVSFTPVEDRALIAVNGVISGEIKISDRAVPYGGVNTNSDWSTWHGTDTYAGTKYEWGGGKGGESFGNSSVQNGKFSIGGLSDGNYSINIWSDFCSQGSYQAGNGANNQGDYETGTDTHSITGDDIRVTVNNGKCEVYNSSGVYLSSYVVINLPSAETETPASITGKFKLLTGSSLEQPVTVIAHQNENTYNRTLTLSDTGPFLISDDGMGYWFVIVHKNLRGDEMYPIAIRDDGGNTCNLYQGFFDIDWEEGRIAWENNHQSLPVKATGQVYLDYTYENIPKTGFTSKIGSPDAGTTNDYSYCVPVSKGYQYNVEIKSGGYGVLWSGN